MSVEDQYRECHENKQESHHNSPSSFNGDNIKAKQWSNHPCYCRLEQGVVVLVDRGSILRGPISIA